MRIDEAFWTLLVLGCALLLAACGDRSSETDATLTEMRADTRPYYWLGESFEGLPLTYADPGALVYGTCEPESEPFSDGGCVPPLQLQNTPCEDGTAGVAIYGSDGQAARAAKALRPLNAAARSAGKPRLSFDRGFIC